MKTKISVKQDPDKPIAAQVIANAIVEIADGMKKLNSTRLSRDAIVTLLHRSCRGVSRENIFTVLLNLESLEHDWLKKKV